MTEHIDHRAKAEQIIAETPERLTPSGAQAWFTEAQVHATLALVEQQRIANEQIAEVIAHVLGTGDRL